MNEELFTQILELSKATAIRDALIPSQDSLYKSICRRFSKRFHTSLLLTYQMDFQEVAEAVFADQFDSLDPVENIDSILDQIYTLEDPNYSRRKEEDMGEFVKMAEQREIVRLQKKKAKKKPEPEKPTSGSVDFGGMLNENDAPVK